MRFLIPSVLVLAATVSLADERGVRTWSDNSGQFTLDAMLVDIEDKKVELRRADTGAVIVVEITKLSEADREYCKEALERVEKDAAMKATEDAFSPGLDVIAESHKSEH